MDKALEWVPKYTESGSFYDMQGEGLRTLAELCTYPPAYDDGDPIELHRMVPGGAWVPRNMCPMGDDRRDPGKAIRFRSNFSPLFPEQQTVIDKSVALLAADESHILQAPTGYGKSILGCEIIHRMGRRALVITTKDDILAQWVDAAKMVLGLEDDEIGLWRGDQVPDPSHKIVVGLVQSIRKGPQRYLGNEYEGFGLCIFDEVHRVAAASFSECMFHVPAKLRLGLSATPNRKDGRDVVLEAHIGRVRVTGTQETLVPRVIRKASGWTVPRGMWHDFNRMSHVYKLMSKNWDRNSEIVHFAVSAYVKDRHIIVFSNFIDHLETLFAMLVEAGVDEDEIGYYVGLTNSCYKGSPAKKKASRDEAGKRPVVLATYTMMSEGTDIPSLDTAILAVPRSDVAQCVGRIRRLAPDKKTPVVFDMVDGGSPILTQFAHSRLNWYRALGCEVLDYP